MLPLQAHLSVCRSRALESSSTSGYRYLLPLELRSKPAHADRLAGMLQFLHHRNVNVLLRVWSVQGLQALGMLGHKLGFSSEIMQLIERALITAAIEEDAWSDDTATAEACKLLLWAQQHQFEQLAARLVVSVATEASRAQLVGAGEDLLWQMVTELQSRVVALRSTVAELTGTSLWGKGKQR